MPMSHSVAYLTHPNETDILGYIRWDDTIDRGHPMIYDTEDDAGEAGKKRVMTDEWDNLKRCQESLCTCWSVFVDGDSFQHKGAMCQTHRLLVEGWDPLVSEEV